LPGSTVHGGSVDGSMDHRGSVDNRSSVDNRAGNSVDDGTGNGNRVGDGDSLRVGSLAVVGDGGDVSLDVVGSVGDVLGAAVREGNRVRSSPGSSAVVSLGSLEVGAGVVVGNGVLVLVGGDLVGVHLGNSVGNRGMVSGGSVDNRGSMDDRAGNSVANNSVGKSVSNNSVGKSVSNNSVGESMSNDTVGNSSNNSSLSKVASKARLGGVADGVGGSNRGNWGTEALGLAGSPDLTLEGLGH